MHGEMIPANSFNKPVPSKKIGILYKEPVLFLTLPRKDDQ